MSPDEVVWSRDAKARRSLPPSSSDIVATQPHVVLLADLQAGLGNDREGGIECRACFVADNVSADVAPEYIWFNFPPHHLFPASPI